MPMLKIIAETPELALSPDEAAGLVAAYDSAILKLGLTDRDDPATNLVAERIITLAKQGERDPHRLRDAVLDSLAAT